jgi:hypothetical protein
LLKENPDLMNEIREAILAKRNLGEPLPKAGEWC